MNLDTEGRRLTELEEENKRLRAALRVAGPIVEAAFYDHHTAGTLPGSGYSHKVYPEVSKAFGWRDTARFNAWKERAGLVR